jgi:5'(3')-deoxyribonucleotidase
MAKIENCLLDLDGCLSQFTARALKKLNKATGMNITLKQCAEMGRYDLEEIYGIGTAQFWSILEDDNDFWINLEPFPWADKILKLLEEKYGDFTIATSPSWNPNCASQKTEWVYKHFGFKNNRMMIGRRKWLMANEKTVLIDDSPKNIVKFTDNGGKGILLPSDWNTYPLTWKMIKKYLE